MMIGRSDTHPRREAASPRTGAAPFKILIKNNFFVPSTHPGQRHPKAPVLISLEVVLLLSHGFQPPRCIFKTLLPAAGSQWLAQASMSFRRFSKRSPRR